MQAKFVRSFVNGGVAYLVGIITISTLAVIQDPFTDRFVDGSSLDKSGVTYFVAHRINFVGTPQENGRPILNTEWVRFEYMDFGPMLASGPSPDQISLDTYLHMDSYFITDDTALVMQSLGILPESILTFLLVLIPPTALILFGALTTLRSHMTSSTIHNILTGGSIVFGYFVMTLLSFHLTSFSYVTRTEGTILVFPDPIASIIIMGIIYPIVFGSIGGALAILVRKVNSEPAFSVISVLRR